MIQQQTQFQGFEVGDHADRPTMQGATHSRKLLESGNAVQRLILLRAGRGRAPMIGITQPWRKTLV